MIENALVLHQAADDDCRLSDTTILDCLSDIQLIDGSLDYAGRAHHKPGEEFLYLLSFLGCSPVVALGAPGATGDSFCHIALLPHATELRLIAGENAKSPRCRTCGHRFEDWRERFVAGDSLRDPLTCPGCGKQGEPARLKWRQSAGISHRYLFIHGIFEGEAVPGETLMGALSRLTGRDWGYFYYRGELPEPG